MTDPDPLLDRTDDERQREAEALAGEILILLPWDRNDLVRRLMAKLRTLGWNDARQAVLGEIGYVPDDDLSP